MYVPQPNGTPASGHVHRVMRHAQLAGGGLHDKIGLGAQDDIRSHDGRQLLRRVGAVDNLQDEVARYQHRRPLTGRAALAVGRAQKVGFIRLGHAAQQLRAQLFGRGQEAMASAQGGGALHVQALLNLVQGKGLVEHLGLLRPFVALVQMRQRRADECIEGSTAATAMVALQRIGVAIAHHVPQPTARTARIPVLYAFSSSDGLGALLRCRQPYRGGPTLAQRERLDQLQYSLERLVFHDNTPRTAGSAAID